MGFSFPLHGGGVQVLLSTQTDCEGLQEGSVPSGICVDQRLVVDHGWKKPKSQRLWFAGALVAEARRGGCTGNGLRS